MKTNPKSKPQHRNTGWLLFGALAAVIPARQAARMDVVAALRFE